MSKRTVMLWVLGLTLMLAAAPARTQDMPAAGGAPALSAVGSAPLPAVTSAPAQSLEGIRLKAQPIAPTAPPQTAISYPERSRLEGKRWPQGVFLHQWSAIEEVPPEAIISQAYLRTRDNEAVSLSLKQAIYLALRNNPGLQADRLDPLASLEGVRQADAVFDPDLTSRLDQIKSVTPTTSVLQTGGAPAFSFKEYDWNFAINKVLASTNGTLGITFNNNRQLTNSAFAAVNPSYNPSLTVSLSQPLLRNFGLRFATITVRMAELSQKQSQFNFESQVSDFIQQVASDYWNVARAEQNLQVAHEGLRLAEDLVRQNEISVRVGVLAPLDIKEAQSEAATRSAEVFSAENTLNTGRATLRQAVMLNPSHVFLPQQIEPSDRPGDTENLATQEEESLEMAMQYRPELAAMRQQIRNMLLEVKYAENQTLPQLNLGAQIGLSATAGNNKCTAAVSASAIPNCVTALGGKGNRLPFGGIYGDALDKLFGFSFYNYAVVLNLEQPLMNDASKAALAQTRIEYEQTRLRYRDLISHIVVDVEQALSNVSTGIKRVHATRVATEYAQESLRAEQERYRVGMANTHELLQFQDTLVNALGNQAQSEVDLEIAKLSLMHAQGTLLRRFQVSFAPQDPHETPWYATF